MEIQCDKKFYKTKNCTLKKMAEGYLEYYAAVKYCKSIVTKVPVVLKHTDSLYETAVETAVVQFVVLRTLFYTLLLC